MVLVQADQVDQADQADQADQVEVFLVTVLAFSYTMRVGAKGCELVELDGVSEVESLEVSRAWETVLLTAFLTMNSLEMESEHLLLALALALETVLAVVSDTSCEHRTKDTSCFSLSCSSGQSILEHMA